MGSVGTAAVFEMSTHTTHTHNTTQHNTTQVDERDVYKRVSIGSTRIVINTDHPWLLVI